MTHPLATPLDAAVLQPSPLLALAAALPAAGLLAGWLLGRSRRRAGTARSTTPAVWVAALAAVGCTAYSADTSWRFAADYLDMDSTAERAAMFAAAELALFATALMARQNLSSQGATGLPGVLVWVITGVQIIPAYAESGPVGGTVRAFVGPVMAAMLWHQAMGIELRLRTPSAASHGLVATLGREARQRMLSRLGIAAGDRDAAQITRDRATAHAVALAARLAERTPQQRASRRGRRLTRRLSKAIGRASVGTDPDQREVLLDQLAARRHALALATVPLPSPWSPHHGHDAPAPAPAGATAPLEGPVPSDGPRAPAGDRTTHAASRGPDPGTVPAPDNLTVPDSGNHEPGTRDRAAGTVSIEAGTTAPPPETAQPPASGEGPGQLNLQMPAQDPNRRAGPVPERDRGPSRVESGTDHTRDRGPAVPLRRKPTAKAKSQRSSRDRGRQTQDPSRELQASADQLVQQVRPHVPAILERDGNETVTRVQLREILRREGLTGGRNDRLSLVLKELRSEATATKTRSTAR